jgi:hypothetical protein
VSFLASLPCCPSSLLLTRNSFDEAQLRFGKGSKIEENFYVRQAGTCSYFFSTTDLASLALSAGLEVEECFEIKRQYANRRQRQARYRVWLHAKLIKQASISLYLSLGQAAADRYRVGGCCVVLKKVEGTSSLFRPKMLALSLEDALAWDFVPPEKLTIISVSDN